ncbi:MAG: O-antigen ligase family protein [Aridibacter sp.]
MPINKNQNGDYNSLGSSKKNGGENNHGSKTLSPSKHNENPQKKSTIKEASNLVNYSKKQEQKISSHHSEIKIGKNTDAEKSVLKPKKSVKKTNGEKSSDEIKQLPEIEILTEKLKSGKQKRQAEKDFDSLKNENWVVRNGHTLTYVGLYCFSILVFFRPYELISGLGFLSATAFYFALATLLIYLPTQLAAEGNLTTLSTEVKCILLITAISLVMMPLAKSPGLAWETFNDSFSKSVIMFVVMVNVLRTRRRLMGIIWLSLSMGFVLSYMALGMYLRGEITVEGYRVAVDVGGMFGNPNELAIHLVMMTPIAFCLGLAAKNKLMKYLYFISAGLFVAANVVTYSRGGFLALLAVAGVLIWKLGKENRLKIFAISLVLAVIFIALAPGEYGKRIFSIFDSSLDAVGSSNQRTDLLKRSIVVTLRNPWGIGIGNFPIVGQHNLVSHNAFTQVSSELGILGLIAYLVFLIIPFRKLGAIERTLLSKDETKWFYYLAVGLQASIIGYMVSSFFASVAYNWFAYYLIAYAVAFRRIYTIEKGLNEEDVKADSLTRNLFNVQIKST